MSVFNKKINEILEKTKLDANELKFGDLIRNTNPECVHSGSEGRVIKVYPMKDGTGVVGNLIRYIVSNNGKTFKPGDILDKTEIQLDKKKGKVKEAFKMESSIPNRNFEKIPESDSAKKKGYLDIIQNALDVAGLEPTIGTGADALNAVISGVRAAAAKEPDQRKKHLMNAGISAVSMVPFADVVKLAKFRPARKMLTKGAKGVKAAGLTAKQDRALKSAEELALPTENYADGKVKGKSRPGRVKRSGASCKGSVSSLRSKAKKAGGEKGKMYHWCANMKGGKKK